MSFLRWMKRIYSRTWTERYFLYNDSRISSFRCDFRADVKSPSVVNLKPEVKPRLEWKLNLPLINTYCIHAIINIFSKLTKINLHGKVFIYNIMCVNKPVHMQSDTCIGKVCTCMSENWYGLHCFSQFHLIISHSLAIEVHVNWNRIFTLRLYKCFQYFDPTCYLFLICSDL